MRRRRAIVASLLAIVSIFVAGCAAPEEPPFERISLSPGPNPFGPTESLWSPQPRRDHPLALALSQDGTKLYVALQGVEDEPGSEVAVVDTLRETVLHRIRVGVSPTSLALHPNGRFLVAVNRFSNFASVIDTYSDEVVSEIPVPFYTVDVLFTPDGARAYLSNRWKDSILFWDIDAGEAFRVIGDNYSGIKEDFPMGIAIGQNPRDLAISEDGRRLYVASLTNLSLSIIDTATNDEIHRVALAAPPGDVHVLGQWVIVPHTGRGTHSPPDEGFDVDGDGAPGDATANIMFQDVQNEIAVLDTEGRLVHEYTSDSICCNDFRDVDPDHPEKGASLPAPDSWPASRLAYLPPKNTWIVAGALPERVAHDGDRLYVVYSGSNEVQSFDVGPDGSLNARETTGGLFRTGMNPFDIAISSDGRLAYVAERLGEHVTVLDLEAGPGAERRIRVGSPDEPDFPATDAEIGEGVNFVTGPLTVDGDQTCVHCHREGGNMARPISMPLQKNFTWGTRMMMAYRGAFDTRPWFFESAMGETNFFPVINEFNRKENFCCEQLDPLVWSKYPKFDECDADPKKSGCNHVLNCVEDPPPECGARTYGSPHLTRNRHFLEQAKKLFGRERAFGDALYEEAFDENEPRKGILLDFNGITRSLGLFLIARPRFFPNPNPLYDSPQAARGRAIYESPGAGCNTCHPLPLTTVTAEFNPFGVPLRIPAVITPRKNPNGENVDTVTPGFLQTFPDAEQDEAGVRFGVPQLRGIWDRADRFYHDGRAPSLREALATPGHPALGPGEKGFNETNGMPDTHGATSHLSSEDLDDLIAFLLTL